MSVGCDGCRFIGTKESRLRVRGGEAPFIYTASSEQAESRTSLLDYAEAQPILASESNVSAHITSPGQGLQRGVTLFYASFVPTSACKLVYNAQRVQPKLAL